MATLEELLDILCENTDMHISVTDTSGITYHPPFTLPYKYRIHSRKFCDMAKSTRKGYEQCMKCKRVCNKLAVHRRKPFGGLCSFGLYEIVYPIIIDGNLKCILYIGNLVKDLEESKKKLSNTIKASGNDFEAMSEHLSYLNKRTSQIRYFAIPELISDFFIHHTGDASDKTSKYHWAVHMARDYIRTNYSKPITLKNIADSCFINPKYLGRIFKSQIGISFHQYLSDFRLKEAASQLRHTNNTVLEIAMNCGFCSASYFNNTFHKKFGMTPSVYKKTFAQTSGKLTADNIFDYL